MSSIYCYLTRPAKVFCELSTLCILNLTYIPECLIFPGRQEQWNWRAIGASPVAFEKCLPKGINSFINMFKCCSQTWMEVKKGPGEYFCYPQTLTQVFHLPEMNVKLIHLNGHMKAVVSVLQPP